jgi:hypothetical protein
VLRRKLLIEYNNIPIEDEFMKVAKNCGDYGCRNSNSISIRLYSNSCQRNTDKFIVKLNVGVKIFCCIYVLAVIAFLFGRYGYVLYCINYQFVMYRIVMPPHIYLLFNYLGQLPNTQNINAGKINGASKCANQRA